MMLAIYMTLFKKRLNVVGIKDIHQIKKPWCPLHMSFWI